MTVADRLKAWFAPPAPKTAKAVTSLGPWSNNVPLSLYSQTPQEKAKAYLQAYKVGWFYKGGKKIADDVSALDWSVSSGDMEEGAAETTLPRPDLRLPFAALSPIDQLQRLLERPNPYQTGRQLLRKTQVRLDFAGSAAWYLEGGDGGLPSAFYGVSPTRLWPSMNSAGQLIGWVLDKDKPTGATATFTADEILWFTTGNAADDDIWGVSVVEAVYSQVPITGLLAQHTADTLALGGRLSGMLWPKDRALTEDEYVDAQRAWRNVASDPNAARRMLIFPEPMEWAQGAATPEQIGIPDLANFTRDEILTAFPISPYRLGVPTPGGLNSGETRREDRKDYWEETIHPRADLLEETMQVGLVSRYEEATGQTFDLEIIEPNMDDAPALLQKTAAFKGLISIGLDPEESLGAVGLDHIKWLGLPQPPVAPPPPQPGADAVTATVAVADTGKPKETTTEAVVAKATKAREQIAVHGKGELANFFAEQRARVTTALRTSLPASKAARSEAVKSDPEWWDGDLEDEELAKALRVVWADSGRQGLQNVADSLGRTVMKLNVRRVLEDLINYGGSRITDINDRTLAAIKDALTEGTRRGYSISQLIDGVPAEGFAGITNAPLDSGVGAFDDARAEMIARTETALSYNRAALDGYREFNVSEVEAIDGDGDPECAERDGQTYSVEDALAIEDHPNGTLDWVPVISTASADDRFHEFATKALEMLGTKPEIHVHNELPDVTVPVTVEPAQVTVEAPEPAIVNVTTPETTVNVHVPEQPVPTVSVEPAVVHLTTPEVTVNVPEQKVVTVKAPPVNVTVPAELKITSMPDRVTSRTVKRDKGLITETVEVETDG